MKARLFLPVLLVAVTLLIPAARAQDVNQVLTNMDKSAQTFNTAVADLTYTKVTVIVDDKAVEKGKVYVVKRKKGDYRVLISFTQPAPKTVLLRDNKGYIYTPSANQVEEYDVGKNKEVLEEFLLLGFGTPGHEMQRAYDITVAGDEKVEGEDTVRLLLMPKSAATQRHIKQVELWVSKKNWQPVQQKFTEPTNDYLLTQYKDLKLNQPVPDSTFDAKWPSKVKTVKPQQG